MESENKKYKLGDSGFWPAWFSKLLFTLISVKVWGLAASLGVSTWLLLLNYRDIPLHVGEVVLDHGLNGAQWVTFNTTIWALIFGMKEIFRITEQRDLFLKDNLRTRPVSEAYTKIISKEDENPDKFENENMDGFETVGIEPENF